MSWYETFGVWQMWVGALLPVALAYAALKVMVSPGKDAARSALLGLAMAKKTGDLDFARAGISLAADKWQARKRLLMFAAVASGLLLTSLAFTFFPGISNAGAWSVLGCATLGLIVLGASKY